MPQRSVLLELPVELLQHILTVLIAENTNGPTDFVNLALAHSQLASACKDNCLLLKEAVRQRSRLLIRDQVERDLQRVQQELARRIAGFAATVAKLHRA